MRKRVLALAGSVLLVASISWAIPSVAQSAARGTAAVVSPSLSAERTFADGSGMVSVTSFGANGHDDVDDTADIQAAINSTIDNLAGPRIIYFPAGTYKVNTTLSWKKDGAWTSELSFQGENQETTTIQLAPGVAPTSNPIPVIATSSLLPLTNGGGNNGYDNFLFDITIDTGTNNPGATAVDFIGNNYCGMRNVTLQSLETDTTQIPAVGLALTRAWTGPCMFRNVTISGFQYGIKTGHTEYSTTFDGLTLKNQTKAGISNTDNVMSIENLTSTNNVPAIQNLGSPAPKSTGLITLVGATLTGGSGTSGISAIQNHETLYARDVTATGYRSAIQDASGNPVGSSTAPNEYDSGPVSTQFGGAASSLNLPIKETPEFEETDRSKWADVTKFGADKTGGADSSAAVQAAIDSGLSTVFFPSGKYKISKTVTVEDNVKMIEGFDSNIVPDTSAGVTYTDNNLFVFNNTVDVIVNHVRFGNVHTTYGSLRFMQDNSSHAVTVTNSTFDRDPSNPGSAYTNSATGTGDLFIENVMGGSWDINGPQHVYARQFDPENKSTKITNNGATVWILGLKIEHASNDDNVAGVINTDAGGKTELLGGLIYPVTPTIPVHQPAFIIDNASASLIYALSNTNPLVADPNTPDGDFKAQVQETQSGVTHSLLSTAVPTVRGTLGLMMPLYTSKP